MTLHDLLAIYTAAKHYLEGIQLQKDPERMQDHLNELAEAVHNAEKPTEDV